MIAVPNANTIELLGTSFAGAYVPGSGRVALAAAPTAVTLQMQFVNCQDYAELTAEVTAGRGQIVEGQAIAARTVKGSVVTATVTKVEDNGIEVEVSGAIGFIRRADLSRDRSEQRPDRFAVGEKVDAKITNVDAKSRRMTLSIKAREIDEDKQVMAEFGSSDSGASLGDILGPALARGGEAEDKK